MQPYRQTAHTHTQQKLKDNPGKKSISFGPSKGKRQIHITASKNISHKKAKNTQKLTQTEREKHTHQQLSKTLHPHQQTHRERKRNTYTRVKETHTQRVQLANKSKLAKQL